MKPQLMLLAVADLITTENVRREYGDLDGLASTFEDGQPYVPPVVHQNERGYPVEHGNRRVEAARQKGITHLYCVVQPKHLTSRQFHLRQLVADRQHLPLGPLERANAMQGTLCENPRLSQVKLAEMLGASETEVSQTLAYLDLCPVAQKALQQGTISEGIAELLIPLDVETQEKVLPDILKCKGKRSGRPTVAAAKRVIKQATMTEKDRQAKEDEALARELEKIRADWKPDLSDKLLDNGEPVLAVHLHHYLLQALDITERAWQTCKPEGCSPDLRKRIHNLANSLKELSSTIEEATK